MIRGGCIAPLLMLFMAGCAQGPSGGGQSSPEMVGLADENARARIHTELGAQYYARGIHAVALQELQEAVQSDSRYAPAYNMFGLVHGALREDAKAEAAFRRALDISPKYSEAHNNFGWFLCERGRFGPALEHFEAALTNPLYVSPEKALANAGACSMRQGNVTRAEDYLRRALARAPNQPVALYHMAWLSLEQHRPLDARNLLARLGETGSLDAPALWLGVRTERQLGDPPAEASYGIQLRRRFPNSQEVYWLNSGQYHLPTLQP